MVQPIPSDHLLFIIAGPSGVGKGSLMAALIEKDSNLSFLTTCITREPRAGEEDGQHYYFLTKDMFRQGIELGLFLEYDEHYENFYGTRRQEVATVFKSGKDAITDLNWPGIAQAKSQMPDNLVSILLLPPSISELERRLVSRTAETGKPLSAERFVKIREDVLHMHDPDYVFTNPDLIGSTLRNYHHVVVNETLEDTVTEVLGIIQRERDLRGVS